MAERTWVDALVSPKDEFERKFRIVFLSLFIPVPLMIAAAAAAKKMMKKK